MTSPLRVVRHGCLALFAVLLSLCALAPVSQAADRAFAQRFTTNDTGDILAIGNTVETCQAGTSSSQAPTTTCAAAQGAAPATAANNGIINNSFNMVYVDTDNDASTFNSSSSNLSLPAGAQVLFAGLYWGGEVTAGSGGSAAPNAAARNTIKFKTPGGAYQTLTATTLDDGQIIYQGFKDVTSLVQAGGNGQYTVGNLQTGTGADRLGGWSLVIAYRDTNQPARNLTVFDGLQSVNGTTGATIPVSGFLTPPSGQVKTELGFISYEGDAGLVGDSASLNNTTLSDATHPANNFFNSHISRDGVDTGNKNPNYANQLGFDISYVKADGILGNSATSATIRTTTSGDVYAPGVITFATEIYAPKIVQTKTVTDDNGGDVEEGDVLTYTITNANQGQDGTSGFVLRDPIPANTDYVPGSITVGGAGKSDTTDNDTAEFETANNRIVARLGTGATGTAGGNIQPGATATVTFKVKVHGPATFPVPSGTKIDNTATANYFSQTTGTPLTATSSASSTVKAPDLVISKSKPNPALSVGNESTYTLSVKNIGDAKTQGTVTVNDTLPSTLTATAVSGNGWTCTGVGSGTVSCTRSDALAPGASYPDILLRVRVGGSSAQNISNTATVSGGGDGNLTNNSSTDTSPASNDADIQLTKTASADTVNIGDAVTFTLVVKNNGTSPATSVAISDPIPGEFTYLDDDGACVFNPPTGVLGCAVGTLNPGESKTIKVRVRAESDGATRTIANTATAGAQQNDPTPGNNSSTANVAITGVDLALTKTLTSSATPSVGDTVTYQLKVRNNGPSNGTAIVLKDMLPSNLGSPSVQGGNCSISGGEVTCNVGDLPAGAEYTATVSGRATNTDDIINRAAVAGAEPDPDTTNNQATVTTPVTAPATSADVSIVKTSSAAQVGPGGSLTYTLTTKNAGPDAANAVTVTDTLPAGVTFASASNGCSESGGTVTCNVGTLAAGATDTRTITVTVTASSGSLVNTANATSTTTDPNPANNTSTVTTGVANTADVSITKSVDKTTPNSGDTIVYTLTAKNNGPASAANVVVTDVLPAGVTYVSSTGTNCTQSAGTVTCNVGTLASGATSTVTITAKVDAVSGGSTGTHQLTVNKVESQLDLDPGQTRTLTIDCGPGYILTDGSVRIDSVDQGTGTLGSAHVLSAHGTTASGFTATVRNDATGRVQAKLFGTCLSATTSTDDGHAHALIVSAPVTTTLPLTGGRQTATVQCGAGKTPIQPGFDLGGGDGRLVTSQPTADGTGWTFTVDVSAPGTGTFSVRCLDQHVTTVDGHTHTLGLEHRTNTVTVPAGGTAEVEVICGDNAKGIVADWDVDAGLIPLGNDPRPKTRTFRFYNPTGSPLTARVGLLCLNDRTGPATNVAKITNTGSVSSTTPDPDTTNNKATADINVGGGALNRSGTISVTTRSLTVTGTRASLRMACLKGGPACVGTLSVKTMTGRVIATRKYAVKAARVSTVVVKAAALRTVKRVKLVTKARDGRIKSRTVLVKHAKIKKAKKIVKRA